MTDSDTPSLADLRAIMAARVAPVLTAQEMQQMQTKALAAAAAATEAARVAAINKRAAAAAAAKLQSKLNAAPQRHESDASSDSPPASPVSKRARLDSGCDPSSSSSSMESDSSAISSAITMSSVASARSFGSSHSAAWSSSISDPAAAAAAATNTTAAAAARSSMAHTVQEDSEEDSDSEDLDSSAYSMSSSDAEEVDLTAIMAASFSSSSSSSSSAAITQASRCRQALVHPQRLLPPRPGQSLPSAAAAAAAAAAGSDSDSDHEANKPEKYSCCNKKCWNRPQYGVLYVEGVRARTRKLNRSDRKAHLGHIGLKVDPVTGKQVDRIKYVLNWEGMRASSGVVCQQFFIDVFEINSNFVANARKRSRPSMGRLKQSPKREALCSWLGGQEKFHEYMPDTVGAGRSRDNPWADPSEACGPSIARRQGVQLPYPNKKELYEEYVRDMLAIQAKAVLLPGVLQLPSSPCTINYFRHVWKKDFKNLHLRKHLRFSRCDVCVELRERFGRLENHCPIRHKATQKEFREHIDFVKEERRYYHEKREAAARVNSDALSIIFDGADQGSYGFPYFHERTKLSEGVEKARYHLIGVIAHGLGSWVYTMSDKWRSDSDVTIEVLQRVLTAIEQQRGGLPSKLYLQMDNCTRENKNQWVLAYLSWLVQRGVFETIELSFLPVGHTHEDIDQLFSRLAVYLRSHDAIDRTMLYEGIVKAFHQFGQTPICSHLESVACIRSVLQPHMLPIANHAGRAILHFIFKPHIKGASIFTKGYAQAPNWDVYDGPDRAADDRGFHLIKPSIPSPPFAADVRPGPSAPKPPVFISDKQQEDVTAHKIRKGIDTIAGDPRTNVGHLQSLWRDLDDFIDRKPVPFNWPHDGQFEKERRALAAAAALDPAAAAPAAAAAAAVANPYTRHLRTWDGPSPAEAEREKVRRDKIEVARASLMESDINKFYKAADERTPAAAAAAAARGSSSSAAAAAAAAAAGGSGLKRGALYDADDIAHHRNLLDHENKVRKLFPERLEVGCYVVMKPNLDDDPSVTLAAEAAAAAAAIVPAAAGATERRPRQHGRDVAGKSRKTTQAAAAAADAYDSGAEEEEEEEWEEGEQPEPAAAAGNSKKKPRTNAGAGKKKSTAAQNKKKPAASSSSSASSSSDARPFWLGKVLKFNRNDGWIRFQDYTPYISREGKHRDVIANAFDGNYYPDVMTKGTGKKKEVVPITHFARWHSEERHLWTFFAAEGMSAAGNLVENVKTRLQEIIQHDPPVRQQLVRDTSDKCVDGKWQKRSKKFPDPQWTPEEGGPTEDDEE